MLRYAARTARQSLRLAASRALHFRPDFSSSTHPHVSPFPRQHHRDFSGAIGATAIATSYGITVYADPSDHRPEQRFQEPQPPDDRTHDTAPITSYQRFTNVILSPQLPAAVAHVARTAIIDAKESGVLALSAGVAALNIGVPAAFALGSYLRCSPRSKPQLFRFMSKHFILSSARLRRGRWHVLFTCVFTHLHWRHFSRNITTTIAGFGVCSTFLNVKEILVLFFASSLVGGLLSVSALSTLTKVPYFILGGSDAMMGLLTFYLCREDREDLPLRPWILKCMCAALVLREMPGIVRLVRYGKLTSGSHGLVDNVAHAGGALTGIAASTFIPRTRAAEASSFENNCSSSERSEEDSPLQRAMEDRNT